ncbi:MAG TPA: MarR family transcriptional regulator [Spirochaetota bacterium]|jgi:DNA-binding MarR family transcriptional regulator|nr:MarR family transcriptional regulator [Spirochaetota bacterium]
MKQEQIISLISKIRHGANELIIHELEKLGIKGIVPSHGDILVRLFREDSMSMSELAAAIGKKKNTVTTLVDKLVNLNYVTKTEDSEDSRITLVKLTPDGKALQRSFDKVSKVLLKTVYNGITEKEKDVILNVLLKMKNNLE